MKQPKQNQWLTRIYLCLSPQTWGKQSFCLWGILVLVMVSGCRNPQSSVINKGPEPNRPYTRQQSALTAKASKPALTRPSPAQLKTNTSDVTTQRPAVPQLQPNQPAQTRATKTIVLGGSPTSQPTAKFETLLTWQSFVGNAKIEKVRVYGEDRPRIVVIHYRPSPTSYVHKKVLFLSKTLAIQAQHDFKYEQLWVPSHGKALLAHLHTSYIMAYTRLFDGSGRLRWKGNPMLVDFAAISTNLQRIVIAERGNAQVLLLNEKGQTLQKLPYIGDALYLLVASPNDQEFVYVLRKFDKQKQKHISIVSRHLVENLGIRWKMTLPYEVSALAAAKQYTAVVVTKSITSYRKGNLIGTTVKSQLLLFNHRGQVLWKKNFSGYRHISFWPNETRMVVDSKLMETHTGRMIKGNSRIFLYKGGKIFSGKWGITSDGELMDLNGKVYDLQIGDVWGRGWYMGCSLILLGSPLGGGLYRLQPPLLNKLIPCKEEIAP